MSATRLSSRMFWGAMIAAIGVNLLLWPRAAFGQEEKEHRASEDAISESEKRTEEHGDPGNKDQAEPAFPDLERMIAVALKHNPDIRAARAKVETAQAELDRTRLGVIRQLTTYRQRYQAQKQALIAAEQQLQQTKEHKRIVPQTALFLAEEKVAGIQSQLADLQAELPFLLGRSAEIFDADGDTGLQSDSITPTSRKTELLIETIRPKLKELLNTTIEDFRTGHTGVREIYDWSRRLMQVEQQLAVSKAARVAAIEAHRDRMQQLLETMGALWEAGQVRERKFLATQFYVEEAKLWLMEERGEE